MYLLRPIGVVPADVDINCRVDANDLSYVVRCWGPVGPTTAERADVNGDGLSDALVRDYLGAVTVQLSTGTSTDPPVLLLANPDWIVSPPDGL